jgi:predicted DNA-binding protein YlxM (UPF0122 family)
MEKKKVRWCLMPLVLGVWGWGCMPPKQVVSLPDEVPIKEVAEPTEVTPRATSEEILRLERLLKQLEEAERRLLETQNKTEEALHRIEEASEKNREAAERIRKAQEKIEAVDRKTVP